MTDILPYEEIEARYAPEWVLLGDITTREDLTLVAGRVLFHGLDRDEVYNKLGDFPPGRYAVECLGQWPEDMVLVL